jgi:heat shock protein HslJ
MKKLSHQLILALLLSLTSACGGTPTPLPEATEPPAPEAVETEPVEAPQSSTLALGTETVTELLGVTWLWAELLEGVPADHAAIPDPENYSLAFHSHGEVSLQADCNQISGTFTLSGDSLTLETGPSTAASCGEDSLDQQYLALLSTVGSASLEGSRLVLSLQDGAGQMIFDAGGPAEGLVDTDLTTAKAAGGLGIDPSSVTLDTMGLPTSWQANLIRGTSYDDSQPPGPMGLPEHIQINLGSDDQDRPNPATRQPGDPVIYIIPVAAYQDLWESNGDPFVTIISEELQMVLADKPDPLPVAGMPMLPFEELGGTNDLAMQGNYLDVSAGSGVRFVGRFAQDPSPVTNDGLRYIFQGFSADGRYLLAFFYPVTTSALPWNDGVPAEERQSAESDPTTYLDKKAHTLDALDSSEWNPNLSILDAVLDSLAFESTITE